MRRQHPLLEASIGSVPELSAPDAAEHLAPASDRPPLGPTSIPFGSLAAIEVCSRHKTRPQDHLIATSRHQEISANNIETDESKRVTQKDRGALERVGSGRTTDDGHLASEVEASEVRRLPPRFRKTFPLPAFGKGTTTSGARGEATLRAALFRVLS